MFIKKTLSNLILERQPASLMPGKTREKNDLVFYKSHDIGIDIVLYTV